MKKVIGLLSAFVLVGFVACGPSAEEKKKMEEQLQKAADSAANALLQQASVPSDTSRAKVTTPADSLKKK